MTESNPLLFDLDNGIAMLTLNRPHEGNALTPALLASGYRVVNETVQVVRL